MFTDITISTDINNNFVDHIKKESINIGGEFFKLLYNGFQILYIYINYY
jgi:hypothetical protein